MRRFHPLGAAWRTRTEVFMWRHGWAGPLALVFGLLAVGLHFFWLQPVREALTAAQDAAAQESRPMPPALAPRPVLDERQRLYALQAVLQPTQEAGELVRRMAALAQAEQIVLAQGDYQRRLDSTTGAVQLQVTQPLKASYPQLRRYIEAVLREMPNTSLDQIAARRDNVGQSQLEIRLRWSLWSYPTPQANVAAAPTGTEARP